MKRSVYNILVEAESPESPRGLYVVHFLIPEDEEKEAKRKNGQR